MYPTHRCCTRAGRSKPEFNETFSQVKGFTWTEAFLTLTESHFKYPVALSAPRKSRSLFESREPSALHTTIPFKGVWGEETIVFKYLIFPFKSLWRSSGSLESPRGEFQRFLGNPKVGRSELAFSQFRRPRFPVSGLQSKQGRGSLVCSFSALGQLELPWPRLKEGGGGDTFGWKSLPNGEDAVRSGRGGIFKPLAKGAGRTVCVCVYV